MKNLFLSVLAMLTMSVVFAQNGGQQNYNTAIKIEQAGSNVKVTNLKNCESIVVVHFNTDVTVTIAASQFVLVPIPTGYANKITAQLKDGCSNDHGQIELMIATPIILTSWTATVDNYDSALVHLAWSVDMESNVAYYRIDGSTDHGLTWDTGIARINSLGDTNLKRDYKKDYYNPLIGMIAKTAGFGAFGAVLAIAIFAGSIRNRALAGTVACLMIIATVACKKDVTAPKQGLKYNAVRLNEVDNDGSVKDFATRQLKR